MEPFEILVVILSIALALLLIVAIAVAIQAYRFFRSLNHLSEKTNRLVDDVSEVVLRTLKTRVTSTIITSLVSYVRHRGRGRE